VTIAGAAGAATESKKSRRSPRSCNRRGGLGGRKPVVEEMGSGWCSGDERRCGRRRRPMASTTGKTAFAVRQMICRALSIGRTAKATLCRAPTPRRTAPINARCRSLCRASLPRRTAKIRLCRASDHSTRQRGPGTCVARDTADGCGGAHGR
jgi:hypothetical protein